MKHGQAAVFCSALQGNTQQKHTGETFTHSGPAFHSQDRFTSPLSFNRSGSHYHIKKTQQERLRFCAAAKNAIYRSNLPHSKCRKRYLEMGQVIIKHRYCGLKISSTRIRLKKKELGNTKMIKGSTDFNLRTGLAL